MNRKDFIQKSALLGTALLSIPKILTSKTGEVINKMKPKIMRKSEGKKLNVLGDIQTIKLTGEDTNGMFTLIEEENAPGVEIPMHVHDNEDEIFKVLEGEMQLTVGDTTTILKAGDLAFGPRGVPHTWKIIGDKKAKVILSVFPSGIEHMFEELSDITQNAQGRPDMGKVMEVCGRYGIRFLK